VRQPLRTVQFHRNRLLPYPAAVSISFNSASDKGIAAVFMFSARCATDDIPGIGSVTLRCNNQAIDSWATRIYQENASGGRWDRPQLHKALEQLRDGDVFVVWKLDRLSRSLKDLLNVLERITEDGAGFRSLTENIDTTTAAGRMMLQMLGAFAEFERSMVRERTRLGLQAARERGRVGGRQPKLTSYQRAEAIKMVTTDTKSAAEVARLFRVHRSSISRLLAQARSGKFA
jgi:DNA invertase Pin-like site-specific DNA recombinase